MFYKTVLILILLRSEIKLNIYSQYDDAFRKTLVNENMLSYGIYTFIQLLYNIFHYQIISDFNQEMKFVDSVFV